MRTNEKLWAFVRGAAIYAGALKHYNAQNPPPVNIDARIVTEIYLLTGDYFMHAFAGRDWAEQMGAFTVRVADALKAGAEYAEAFCSQQRIETACERAGTEPGAFLYEAEGRAADAAYYLGKF
jgi:hypothetical protein